MPADPGSATIPLAATLGSHPDRRAALTLIVALQGEDEFLFGLYVGNPDARHFDVLAPAGFDFTYVFNSGDPRLGDYMGAAADDGIEVIPHWISGDPDFVDRYENEPGLMAWGLHDDANWSSFTPEDFVRDAAAIRADDDFDHPIHTSVIGFDTARYPDYTAFLETVDIANVQVYPFGRDEENIDLDDVYRASVQLVETAERTGTVPMHAGQAFSWDDTQDRHPTPEQQDAMFYTALVAGVEGMSWYPGVSWETTDADPYIYESQPALWDSMTRNIAEMAVIEDAVMNGDRVSTDWEDVHAATWSHEGKVLLVLVNGDEEAREVSLDVPEVDGGVLQPVFEDRPGTMTLSDGTVEGIVAPLETQIYEIVDPSPGPVEPDPGPAEGVRRFVFEAGDAEAADAVADFDLDSSGRESTYDVLEIAFEDGAPRIEPPRLSRRPRDLEGWGPWEPGHQERRTRPSYASGRCGWCASTRAATRRGPRRCG